jgi:hypothetical protein
MGADRIKIARPERGVCDMGLTHRERSLAAFVTFG